MQFSVCVGKYSAATLLHGAGGKRCFHDSLVFNNTKGVSELNMRLGIFMLSDLL